MAGAVGAAAGGVGDWVMAGAVLVDGGGGVGVFGGGVLVAGAGGGASLINTASTVLSAMRTTWRAKPELMAHNNSRCSATTNPISVRCLRVERCRLAYGEVATCETARVCDEDA